MDVLCTFPDLARGFGTVGIVVDCSDWSNGTQNLFVSHSVSSLLVCLVHGFIILQALVLHIFILFRWLDVWPAACRGVWPCKARQRKVMPPWCNTISCA